MLTASRFTTWRIRTQRLLARLNKRLHSLISLLGRAQNALYAKSIDSLGRQPAFLLIFAISLLFGGGLIGHGVFTRTDVSLYVGLVAFALALVAAIIVVWIITRSSPDTIETVLAPDRTVTVQPRNLQVSADAVQDLDLDRFFRDDIHGFRFLLPKSGNWTRPEPLVGLEAIAAERLVMSAQLMENLKTGMKILPYGAMIADQWQLRVKSGQSAELRFLPETTTDLAEDVLERLGKEVKIENPDISDDEINQNLAEIRQGIIRQGIEGIENIKFFNEFCVTCFTKTLVVKFKPTLANIFFIVASQIHGTAREVRTSGNNITLFTKMTIRNLSVNGRKMDLSTEKVYLFTEGEGYFYQVEVVYSPQTEGPFAMWQDLRNMIESFQVIV